MKRPVIQVVILVAVALCALTLRCIQLELRPMHHDEANQAERVRILLETGEYRYDPQEHHGPSLYYLALPLIWTQAGGEFTQATEQTLRLLPVLFGAGLILLLLLVGDGLGRTECIAAGVLTAVSPAMVYYSRFFIQEMLLVFFTLGAVGAIWRYVRSGSVGWACTAGALLGLMHATKETCIIAYFAIIVAVVVVALWGREQRRGRRQQAGLPADGDRRVHDATGGMLARIEVRHLGLKFAVAALVSMLLFSSFLTNAFGPLDSVRAYLVYLARGGGDSAHLYPWNYYIRMLAFHRSGPGQPVWSEGFILLLALVGAAVVLRRKGRWRDVALGRFFLVYTLVLVAVYSAIAYKTPWNMLLFLHGMIVLAGIGVGGLVRLAKTKWTQGLLAVLLAAGLGQLSWQTLRTNYSMEGLPAGLRKILPRGRFYADPRNPYAYVQTTSSFLRLVKRIEEISAVAEVGNKGLVIAAVLPAEKSWPLPWYLRGYDSVGFWPEPAALPVDLRPALVITSEETEAAVSQALADGYQSEYHGLRPGVLLTLRIRKDLWQEFMAGRR